MVFVFVWVVGMVLGVAFNQDSIASSYITVNDTQYTVSQAMNILSSFNAIEWEDIWGPIKFPKPNADYFTIILKVFTWDFSFMTGYLEIARWLFFVPITAAGVFGFLMLFISAIQGIMRRS